MRPVDRLATELKHQLKLELPPLNITDTSQQAPEAREFQAAPSESQDAVHGIPFGNYAAVPSYYPIPYGPPPTPEPFVNPAPTQVEPAEWDVKPVMSVPYPSAYPPPYCTVQAPYTAPWSSTFGVQNPAWQQFMTNANLAADPVPQETAWGCGPIKSRRTAPKSRRSDGPHTMEERRRRNRETAARCRERKLAHVAALEAQLREEREKNQKLEEHLTLLKMENDVLHMFCENNRNR